MKKLLIVTILYRNKKKIINKYKKICGGSIGKGSAVSI